MGNGSSDDSGFWTKKSVALFICVGTLLAVPVALGIYYCVKCYQNAEVRDRENTFALARAKNDVVFLDPIHLFAAMRSNHLQRAVPWLHVVLIENGHDAKEVAAVQAAEENQGGEHKFCVLWTIEQCHVVSAAYFPFLLKSSAALFAPLLLFGGFHVVTTDDPKLAKVYGCKQRSVENWHSIWEQEHLHDVDDLHVVGEHLVNVGHLEVP